MTVLEHLKAAGYDPERAWNAARLTSQGTMECERIEIRTWECRPECRDLMTAVEGTAVVLFSDGTMKPYPSGWDKSIESRVVLYFREGEVKK